MEGVFQWKCCCELVHFAEQWIEIVRNVIVDIVNFMFPNKKLQERIRLKIEEREREREFYYMLE